MYVFEKKTAKWMFLKIDIAYLYVVIINNLFIVTVLSLFIKRTHVKLLSLVMGRIYEISIIVIYFQAPPSRDLSCCYKKSLPLIFLT